MKSNPLIKKYAEKINRQIEDGTIHPKLLRAIASYYARAEKYAKEAEAGHARSNPLFMDEADLKKLINQKVGA